MSKHRSSLAHVLAIAAMTISASVLSLACAPAKSTVPPGARVEILQTQRLVLHGTAAAHPESATCASSHDGSTPQYLQLNEDMTGNIALRPVGGVAVLHLQELATNRTWCVMTHDDGTGAAIPGDFPGGVYAITVEGSHAVAETPYAVVVEKL
ncbi:MAG TPA: hypothetical protein VGG39_07460 [Polyangiaceae bacterium]|jgi:hypothetical protein